MGLRMEGIHGPSIPSSSNTTTANSSSSVPLSRDEVLRLVAQKDNVEAELTALGSVLDSHNVNMRTTLTTFDGYPRDDIDVAQIRTTRARIIRLQNDYRGLMSQIEKGLHALHQANAPALPISSRPTALSPSPIVEAPFAQVDSVAPSSPADEAGLEVGDKIKRFGSVGALNHEKLAKVAIEVQTNEGKDIRILVSRIVDTSDVDVEISLKPRRDWGGRGMLGCHLVPL